MSDTTEVPQESILDPTENRSRATTAGLATQAFCGPLSTRAVPYRTVTAAARPFRGLRIRHQFVGYPDCVLVIHTQTLVAALEAYLARLFGPGGTESTSAIGRRHRESLRCGL